MVLRWHCAVVLAGSPGIWLQRCLDLWSSSRHGGDLTMPLRQWRHHERTSVRSRRHQETKPPGPSKTRTRAQKGSNKGCFCVTVLSGKTLTMTASLDSSVSSLVHRVLNLDSTLSQAGISWDVSVRMCFRLNGGVKHEVPGSWTCMVCNMGGCWAVRQNCFRCGAARGSGPSFPAGREMRYPV